MENNKNIRFKAVTRLNIFDIKAQKKTIPYKKFCNIPLSYEEQLKENFDMLQYRPIEDGYITHYTRAASKG